MTLWGLGLKWYFWNKEGIKARAVWPRLLGHLLHLWPAAAGGSCLRACVAAVNSDMRKCSSAVSPKKGLSSGNYELHPMDRGSYVKIFFLPKNKPTHRRRKMAANFNNASTLPPLFAALCLLNNVPAFVGIYINGRLTNKCVTFRALELEFAGCSVLCWSLTDMTPCSGQLDFMGD